MWLTHGVKVLCCCLHQHVHAGLELQLFTRSPEQLQHRIAELIPKGGAALAQLVCHPDLMALLSQYLGHNFRCATFSSNTLLSQGNPRSDLMHGHSQASLPISMCLSQNHGYAWSMPTSGLGLDTPSRYPASPGISVHYYYHSCSHPATVLN